MPTPANILYNTRYEVKTALPLEFFAEHEGELLSWVLDLAIKFDPVVGSSPSNLYRKIPQSINIDSASWTGAKPHSPISSTPTVELMAYRDYDPRAHEVSWAITFASTRDRDAIHDGLRKFPYFWPKPQPQTLEQLYGLHRRTAAQVYGSPDRAPGLSPGGATAHAPVAVSYPGLSATTGKAFRAVQAKSQSGGLAKIAQIEASMDEALRLEDKYLFYTLAYKLKELRQKLLQQISPPLPMQLSPQAQPLPLHEGLKPGEIIAWRAWKCQGQGQGQILYSTAMSDFAWTPGQVIKGDPSTHGIHAFKNLGNLLSYISSYNNSHLAIGKVALWGEIVEHELGYRAEFAKVYEICDVVGQTARSYDPSRDEMSSGIGPVKGTDLAALRKLYSVEERT